MSSRIIARIAVPAVIAAAAMAGAAVPALAQGGPVSAAVVVPSTLTITLNATTNNPTGTSFTVAPGSTTMDAVNWTILSNDPDGYSLSESATVQGTDPGGDLLGGAYQIPDSDLTYIFHYMLPGGTGSSTVPAALTDAPTGELADTGVMSLPGGDTWSQDWTAAAVSVPQGSYDTQITYSVTGRP